MLDAHVPSPDDQEDRRGFEWHYLDRIERLGKEAILCRENGPIYALAFSPDGRELAVATPNGAVQLWDRATCQVRATLTGHRQPVRWLAYSEDGKAIATASEEFVAKKWDVNDGVERQTITLPHLSNLRVAISPCLARIAVAGDEGVRILDAETGAEALSIKNIHVRALHLTILDGISQPWVMVAKRLNGLFRTEKSSRKTPSRSTASPPWLTRNRPIAFGLQHERVRSGDIVQT